MTEETLVKNPEAALDNVATEAPDVAPVEAASQAPPPSEAEPAKTKSTPKPKKARYYIPVTIGQKMTGKIKTVADFGAFVNLGLSVDGLVHISSMSRRRVEKVSDLVSVGDEVTVWVKSIDADRGRIGLTMIKPVERKFSEISEGDVLEGEVKRIESYGVFVDVGLSREGLVHVSELSYEYVQNPTEVIEAGRKVDVKVLNIDRKKKRVNLSIKALLSPPEVKVEKIEKKEEEKEIVVEEVSLQTSMAAAFGVQGIVTKPLKKKKRKRRRKHKKVMDEVIARTLQTTQTD